MQQKLKNPKVGTIFEVTINGKLCKSFAGVDGDFVCWQFHHSLPEGTIVKYLGDEFGFPKVSVLTGPFKGEEVFLEDLQFLAFAKVE